MKLFEHDAPLGLPSGSIRALLALMFVLTYCIGGLAGIDVGALEKPVYTIVGIYFVARVAGVKIKKILEK